MTAGARGHDLYVAVERMRECREIYARTNDPSAKAAAKRCEREVDAMRKDIRRERNRESRPELTGGNG
ncbi:MAG: hypothetical protein FWD94_01940 [Treponema sp.]|nr:hypothetical protein [Treponema sp.]